MAPGGREVWLQVPIRPEILPRRDPGGTQRNKGLHRTVQPFVILVELRGLEPRTSRVRFQGSGSYSK